MAPVMALLLMLLVVLGRWITAMALHELGSFFFECDQATYPVFDELKLF